MMTVTSSSSLDFTTFSNVIDGKLTQTASTRQSIDPATGEELFPSPVSTRQDVDDAINAARVAFKSWKRTTVEHRKKQVRAFSAALLDQRSDFANLLTKEQGKAVRVQETRSYPHSSDVSLDILFRART
jgi:acyl-CoA reductase-like NAD-dependent aldehyde dehydrogenase